MTAPPVAAALASESTCCGDVLAKKTEVVELERKIRINDPEYNATFGYAKNFICTSKYSFLSFLPKNLFEQFQRIANAYFLCLLVLQLIPQISSLTWVTTVIPLVAVLSVTALKDAVDDLQRHRSDNQVNNRRSLVLRDGEIVEECWHTVAVGDIIKMENNQFVAADLFLLSTSEPNSLCYIETAELDGETNLKVKQALPETAALLQRDEDFKNFRGELVCEPPNNRLCRFDGVLRMRDETYAIDNACMLLRGCVLRNTRWCYGVVVFAGRDTKLMMNSGQASFKRTHIDRLMNVLIIGIFIFLVTVCLICTVCAGFWESLIGYKFQVVMPWDTFIPGSLIRDADDAGTKTAGATVLALMVFFSYIIILNTVVPISLYVSVEVIRFGHSWWINWDKKMYYAKTNTPAKSRTTTLNEELGQIEYIFSDKTGTLTQNIMTFNKCSIGGKAYGDPVDAYGIPMDVTVRTPKVDFSDNSYFEPQFDFYDDRLLELVRSGDEEAHKFFILLALCHTVMPEVKDDKLEYQAQSPDEAALVSAARNFGFVFKSRTAQSITIQVFGETLEYELLCILDFNNVRKRMSVIVRREGRIMLYCKGADTTVYQKLDKELCSDMMEFTTSHLNDFATEGLRTLCLAMKEISAEEYEEWKKKHHAASTSMQDRDEKLSEVYEEIEKNMILIGATAIEDRLQDGVPDAIANLGKAGIKIWVLTGDKQETAINIGYSCNLLSDDLEDIHVVDGDTHEQVTSQLRRCCDEIRKSLDEMTPHFATGPRRNAGNGSGMGGGGDFSYMNGRNGSPGNAVEMTTMGPAGEGRPPVMNSAESCEFALVINGHSLVYALSEKTENLLLEAAGLCKAVICCRVTPLQKAQVVNLVKKHKKCLTLAIGDGANDVSMIKAAHIGIGISGQEGMQAVLSSDFSLAQFAYLERLLLVHGRWSYLRMCKFLKYFFYKNFAFTLCHFWFAFFCGFSAQTLYDEVFISLYNVCFTSLPVLALGIFDQDVNEEYSRRYPKLYAPGQLDMLFNKKVFALSAAEGIISSLVLFFIPYAAFYDAVRPDAVDLAGHKAFGLVVASTLIVAVTLRCALETSYWTMFNHIVIWGSIVFYFALTFVFYSDLFGYTYAGTARAVMSTATFWLTLVLTVTILLVPVVAERFYATDTRPTLADRVRVMQRKRAAGGRTRDMVIRRSSTLRRSTRSLRRSGYAFSHAEGFGRLITTGANMPPNDTFDGHRSRLTEHFSSTSLPGRYTPKHDGL